NPDSTADATFNPDDAIRFWDVTNRQDWHIVEQSQLGIASRRYTPGPYSPRESMPAAWDREYLRMMGRERTRSERRGCLLSTSLTLRPQLRNPRRLPSLLEGRERLLKIRHVG